MSVLVTGAAGFIGSNLVDELIVQGHEVVGFDDLSEGKMENISQWKGHKRFTFIRGSILDRSAVQRAAEGASMCAHLAADSRIQTGIADPLHSIETNVVGTANVAEACRQAGVKRIVYAASSSAYGRNMLPENGFDESCRTDCLNPYSMSKKAGEDVLDVYCRLYGLSTCSLRLFNVYGPRHQEEGRYATVIAIFRKQLRQKKKMTIVGNGSQRRDFTFVGDVIRAFMLALHNREATGIVNIGTGSNLSITELASWVAEASGRSGGLEGEDWLDYTEHIPERLGEAQVTLADRRRAGMLLGWKPQVDLTTGLRVLNEFERKFPPHGIVLG